jgi:DNA-binding response OmpR family regulator
LVDIECALQLGWASIEVLHAHSPSEAIRLLQGRRTDIVVIETREGSTDLAREIRRVSSAVIVAVSRRYEESELIAAVEAGCDDYMQLPVSPATFVARVRAALRRVTSASAEVPSTVAACGSLELDPAGYEARVRGRRLNLTAKEFELLLHLVRHSGQVARHEALSRLIWGDDGDLYGPWLRKYIQHLRQKLADAPRSDVSIVTVPKVGYKLVNGGKRDLPQTA